MFRQSIYFIFSGDASTVLRIPLFKRAAGFANVKLVAVVIHVNLYTFERVPFERVRQVVTWFAV